MKALDCSAHVLVRACCAGAAVLALVHSGHSFANDVEYEAEEPGFRDVAAEYMADYFSDPRRTGSLAGGIIGGALTAHPIGPVIGGIIGFMIGKRSVFSEDSERVQRQVVQPLARRQIVPASGGGEPVATLSFGSLTPVSLAAVPNPNSEVETLAVASPSSVNASSAVTLPVMKTLNAPVEVIATQAMIAPVMPQGAPIVAPDRLASLCANGPLADPRLRALCYYSHSN